MLGLGGEFPSVTAHFEVLGDGHAWEDAAPLRSLDQPVRHPPVRLDLRDVHAAEPHRTRRQRAQPRDRTHHRGLASTVRPQQRHEFALAYH